MSNQQPVGRLQKSRLLMVGNFLSASHGTRFYCEDLADQLRVRGRQLICTSNRSSRLLRFADMCRTVWMRRSDYDFAMVDVYSGPSFLWAGVIATILHKLGKPYVLVLRGGGLQEYQTRAPRRVAALLTSANVVVTPSLFLRHVFSSLRSDIRWLPNALPIANYPYRKREGLAPNLAWLRGFHSIYNPMLAVRTVELLRTDFPGIQLTMYGPNKGDGSLAAVKAYIREHRLDKLITIPGPVPKQRVSTSLAQHDLFLNTTRYESFGVCVAEAAACGLPVVTTAVGELPYLWQDGESALLVPEGDAEAMASAVRRLLTEHGLAERLSHNARKKVEQFDWSFILPQWDALFAEITAENERNKML